MLRLLRRRREPLPPVTMEVEGHCPACDHAARFVARDPWLRDHFHCARCDSVPRERALMVCIERFFPAWRSLVIHESSPIRRRRGTSARLRSECPGYSASQFYPGAPLGEIPSGKKYRNEDLEQLTLPDASVDLFVTQDVLEHIFDPARAFAEIRRVLRPDGAHVFSVPLVSKDRPTKITAERGPDGAVVHHVEPSYHCNPATSQGSLVTREWGYDICDFIMRTAGMPTTMVVIDDLGQGIRAEYIEILVSRRLG